jgi:hypothetical protein
LTQNFVAGWVLAAGCLAGFAAGASAQVVDAKVCDVVNHPKQFDGKIVRVKGIVQTDFDSFLMRGDACNSVLWLSYPAGTKAKSGPAAVVTLQLAANSAGNPGTARPAVALERNKDFETFDALLSAKPKVTGMCLGCVKNDVTATLVGRIDGTENPGVTRDKSGAVTGLDGFGNLNQYMARMVIQSVSEVTAKEIDFSKIPKIQDDNQGNNGKDWVVLTRKTEESFPKGNENAATIEKAIVALTSPVPDNGVAIVYGDVAGVPDGEGAKSAKNSTDGLIATVRVDRDKIKGDAESRAMAHQGAEVAMIRDAGASSSLMTMETRAWQTALLVTIGAHQKTLTLPGGLTVWSEDWTPADRPAKASAALTQYLSDREETP